MGFGNRTATVFGGSGFIGRHLIRRLAKDGTVIRVPTRQPENAKFLMTNGAVGQIVPERIDLRDDKAIAGVVAGSDVVINLVGILAESGDARFQAVHSELPARIARAAADAGVKRFVQLSAIGASPGSAAAYARSKASGELAVQRAFPQAVILRPSIVFGPEDNFFNKFACMARLSPALPLIGGGHTRFQPVYVGDVAAAIMAALSNPKAPGNIYELGGPEIYSFRELLQLVLHETRRRRLLLPIPWGLAALQGSILGVLPARY